MTLYPENKFSVDIRFDNITLDYVLGYFGQNEFTIGPDETEVDLFGDLDVQGLSIEEADVELEIRNYFRLEGYFRIGELTAKNTATGQEASLEGPMVGADLFIDRAVDVTPGGGEVIPSIHTYDFSESNFGELFSMRPERIAYTVGIETNINGDSTNYNNFFYYDEPIRVYMRASIDQGIRIDDLLVESTVDWNGGGAELDKVREGHLVMVYSNGFPFNLDVEMVLLDEEEVVLDTLITGGFIAGGMLDEQFRVTEPVETRLPVALTDELRSAVAAAKYARYSIFINSVDNAHVKVYADDILRLKVIGDLKYIIEQE